MSLLSIAAAALALSSTPAEPGVCRGPAAQPGQVVTGVVLHVIDSERLCLAGGPTPDQWVEVTLSKHDLQPIAQQPSGWSEAVLMSAAFGKKLSCRVDTVSGGRAVSTCALGPASLAATLSAPDAQLRAGAWYKPSDHDARTLIASR